MKGHGIYECDHEDALFNNEKHTYCQLNSSKKTNITADKKPKINKIKKFCEREIAKDKECNPIAFSIYHLPRN